MATIIKSDVLWKRLVPKLDVVTIGFREEIKKQKVIKNSRAKGKNMKMLRFSGYTLKWRIAPFFTWVTLSLVWYSVRSLENLATAVDL